MSEGQVRQVVKELEGKTVMYRATVERVKEAVVVEQSDDPGEVLLEVKVDDPSDRLHGFNDEEVAAGKALRISTCGGAPGCWFMPDDQNDEAMIPEAAVVEGDSEDQPIVEGADQKDEPTV